MIKNSFQETLKSAIELRNSLKCLDCKKVPEEPYLTGVCDHILCKECISKKNICPICSASFFKNESSMNLMFKEAILYVNEIICLAESTLNNSTNQEDTSINNSKTNNNQEESIEIECTLPDLDMISIIEPLDDSKSKENINNPEEKAKSKSKPQSKIKESNEERLTSTNKINNLFVAPLPPTIIVESLSSQLKKKTAKNSTQSQRSKKTPAKETKNTLITNNVQIEESQISRTQSTKRVKKNLKGETPLHLAVLNGDIEKVKELLNDPSTEINAHDFSNWTPLHEACNNGNLEIIKILIDKNANVNAPGNHKNTPLHEASIAQKFECIEYLLQSGANPSLKNEHGILARDLVKNLKKFTDLFDKYKLNNESSNVHELSQSQFNVSTNFDDLNISCTFSKFAKKGKTNKSVKKVTLYGSGMANEDRAKFTSLAKNLNLSIAKEMNNNVTHVVFCGNGKTCNRTLNYMKAILMGIWIVNIKWLEDSVEKGILVEENEYEAAGSNKLPKSGGPFQGRINVSGQYPKLFEDCFFYLHGEFETFTKPEFLKLIETGGGTILKREPKLERIDELMPKEIPHHLESKTDSNFQCSHFILYDTKTTLKDIKHKYLYTVKPNWLFTCIDEFKILKP